MSQIDVDKGRMDRESLLKRAGLGAGVLALPALVGAGTAAAGGVPGMGDGHQFWAFVAFSQGATIDGVSHRIAMNGCGTLKPNGQAKGGGGFVHFDNASSVPRTIIASGTWEVRRFLDYIVDGFGDWGVVRASILEAEIELNPQFPSPAKIPATLRLICNIGPAGISTGEDEGFLLTVPGSPPSPFEQLVPALGLTVISTPGGA